MEKLNNLILQKNRNVKIWIYPIFDFEDFKLNGIQFLITYKPKGVKHENYNKKYIHVLKRKEYN